MKKHPDNNLTIMKTSQIKPSSASQNLSIESKKRAALMRYLHQDTSLSKSLLSKEKTLLERKQLIIKQKLLQSQTKVRNIAIAQRTIQERWDELKQQKVKLFSSLKAEEDRAAITIQRHVRGFLLRVKTEDDFIDMIEAKAARLISSSTAQALNIMLNLGVVLVPATRLIQQAFKRYLFRKKLYRLQDLYTRYQRQKLEQAANFLKAGVRYLLNLKTLQSLRFLEYREKKLKEIKENLAILVIKNYWRIRKFTYRVMRDKILRVKRRQAAMLNKEAFARYLNSIGGKLERKATNKASFETEEEKKSDTERAEDRVDPMPEEENEEMMDDEEFLEAQRIQDLIKKRIQEKVDKGKLSHGINYSKQVMVLPLMQEKALKDSPSADNSKLMNFTTSVFAKGRSLSRAARKPNRHTLISSPPSYEHKKISFHSDLGKLRAFFTPEPELKRPSPTKNIDYAEFMAPTIAFKKKKFRSGKSEGRKRDFEYIPLSSNLVVPTIAYSLKQQNKKMVEKKKNWSFRSDGDKYVTSVSNNSYSPVPWKPLPLNRNILVTTEYGKSFYREKQQASCHVVDFSSRVMTPELPRITRDEFGGGFRTFNYSDDI
jgi:hypothetical protein